MVYWRPSGTLLVMRSSSQSWRWVLAATGDGAPSSIVSSSMYMKLPWVGGWVGGMMGAEYTENRIGERGDPRGRPESNQWGFSVWLLKVKRRVRLVQWSWVQPFMYLGKPDFVMTSISRWCLTVLKALSMLFARMEGLMGKCFFALVKAVLLTANHFWAGVSRRRRASRPDRFAHEPVWVSLMEPVAAGYLVTRWAPIFS